MTIEFFSTDHLTKLEPYQDFTFSRLKQIESAVKENRDFEILGRYFQSLPAGRYEYLVVDVQTDEVPSSNSVGINYCERMQICLSHDGNRLPEVRALRKEFPILPHQNQGLQGEACSLCLYHEAPSAVYRTWTPQKFLKRIQWWLGESANETLHPDDQALEALFFTSPFELVLPHDFDELYENDIDLVITRGIERPNHGLTCFLQPAGKEKLEKGSAAFFGLTIPPVVHGFIESDPKNLGQLSDLFTRRGSGFEADLRAELMEKMDKIGAQGLSKEMAPDLTVILIRIPICREAGQNPERYLDRAFILQHTFIDLGVAMDQYFSAKGDGVYTNSHLLGDAKQDWRELQVFAMEVLVQNRPETARLQSGIPKEGPNGTLLGVGALGSALIDMWGRSGWGKWTVVDHDHIRPHNLSRHTADFHNIGQIKVDAVAEAFWRMSYGSDSLEPVYANALRPSATESKAIYNDKDIVIDATTTLEYPRRSSQDKSLPRHVSTFLTPDGNGSVIMLEDSVRELTLAELEMQYYRYLLTNTLGDEHLLGSAGKFASGTGCRDVSVVMPYSKIMTHAGTIAFQLPQVLESENPLLKIWQLDPAKGSVEAHDIVVEKPTTIESEEMTIVIDPQLEAELKQRRKSCLPNETGGVLLGYYDFNIESVFVVATLSPPPDSVSSPTGFKRGHEGLLEEVTNASKRTGGVVGYIGEWHSHPDGCTTSMSGHDIEQLAYLASEMANDGMPALSLIVGEKDDISIYKGEISK